MIEMCKFYDVKLIKGGFMKARCSKGRFASLKCHSERLSCPDYKPSPNLNKGGGYMNYFSGRVIIQKGFPIRFRFYRKGIVIISFFLPFLKKWFMWSWLKEEEDGS